MRFTWVMVGAVAIFGGLWFAPLVGSVTFSMIHNVPFLATLFVGAFAGGAMIARHSRNGVSDPLVASLLASMILMIFASVDDPGSNAEGPLALFPDVFWYVPLVVTPGAVAGAFAGRRFDVRAPTLPTLMLLSGLISVGAVMISMRLIDEPFGGIVGGVLLGGFLTQVMTPMRRRWVCGSGCWLLLFLAAERTEIAFVGAIALCWPIGALGAWVAARAFPARFDKPVVPEMIAR